MIRLTPPTPKGYISSGWGADRSYRGGTHEGLDFPSNVGTPVLAAADGKVFFVKNVSNSFAGKWIGIDHGNGIFTRYLHNTKNLVNKGDLVKRGQQIALLGTTGTSGKSAPHVHFDVKLSDSAFAEYKNRYGTPTTGFGQKSSYGYGVPGETFVSGATYKPAAKDASKKRGVVFYKGASALVVVGLLGAAYLVYKVVK